MRNDVAREQYSGVHQHGQAHMHHSSPIEALTYSHMRAFSAQ